MSGRILLLLMMLPIMCCGQFGINCGVFSNPNTPQCYSDPDLILYFPFNSNFLDSTCNHELTKQGSTQNSITFVDRVSTNDAVFCPDGSWLESTKTLTGEDVLSLSFWTYFTNISGKIGQGDDINNRFTVTKVLNLLYIVILPGGSGTVSNMSALDSTWVHIVIIYNGAGVSNSDKIKCFVNNVERTVNFSGTIPTSIPLYSGLFGVNMGDSPGNRDYSCDELRLYNKLLTISEINELFNQ